MTLRWESGLRMAGRVLTINLPDLCPRRVGLGMSFERVRRVAAAVVALLFVAMGSLSLAAQQGEKQDPPAQSASDAKKAKKAKDAAKDGDYDPRSRQLDEKTKQSNQKALKQELRGEYKSWLNEDVRWIITDEERE